MVSLWKTRRKDSLSLYARYNRGSVFAIHSTLACWLGVRFEEALPNAILEFLSSVAVVSFDGVSFLGRPLLAFGCSFVAAFASRQASTRTESRASIAHSITWNGSTQRLAFGQYSFIHSSIHLAPSPDTN